MKKRIAFIVNPIAGRKKNRNLALKIRQIMNTKNCEFSVFITEKPGHASEIARVCVEKKFDIVVAVGGDGTLGEIAKALVNTDTPLGIIPAGSGNGLARHLKLSFDLNKNIESILSGDIIPIDTCLLNDKPFFSIAGIGFDAFVAHRFAKMKGRGLLNYIRAIIKNYFTYKPQRYKLVCNGKVYAGKVLFLSMANSNQFGYNASIAPDASLTDGLLDVCLLRKIPWYKAFNYTPKLFNGKLKNSKYLDIIKTSELIIYLKRPEFVHLDGDPAIDGSLELRIRVIPQSLYLCFPPQKSNR